MAAASDHVRPWQRILIGGCHLDDYECTTVAAVRSCCQDFLKGYDELSAAESTDVEASAGLRLLADALLRYGAPALVAYQLLALCPGALAESGCALVAQAAGAAV